MAQAAAVSDVGVGSALEVRGTVLVPLFVVRKHCGAVGRGLWLHGQCCAAAVLVKEANGALRAFAVDGTERDPQVLMAAFPEIAERFASVPG